VGIETYRFTIEGNAAGYHVQNVLHFNVDNNTDATPLALASELVAKWDATFEAMWLDLNSEQYTVRYVQAKRVLPSGGNSVWKEFPEGNSQGLHSGEITSLSLAPILKLYPSLAANTQGRIFLPPPYWPAVADNVINSGYHTDCIDFGNAIISFTATHDWQLAIYSRTLGTAYAVTAISVSNILGQIGKRRVPQ